MGIAHTHMATQHVPCAVWSQFQELKQTKAPSELFANSLGDETMRDEAFKSTEYMWKELYGKISTWVVDGIPKDCSLPISVGREENHIITLCLNYILQECKWEMSAEQ